MFKSFIIVIITFSHISSFSQEKNYSKVDSTVMDDYQFCIQYFNKIPSQNIRIKKKKQLIPLTTTPSIWNLFKKKENWTYRINISSKTIERFTPILYDNLSIDGRIGVLAHELSHVHDFQTSKKSYLIKVFFSHVSSKKMDAFEYNTDLICIKQGMGNYLYAWSTDVKESLDIEQWEGKNTFNTDSTRERYMRPETICKYINQMNNIYNHTKTPCSN
ncbi:hypothetical protein SAMN06298216_2928 [Spirosomataceae bacterium TFI 002]|nr:hypothetical protein SAMN06298216_2928 [Spirosomataceae bacterium TFI 002]